MDEIQTLNIAATVHGRYLLRPAAGGEGAPLAPFFHYAALGHESVLAGAADLALRLAGSR